MLYTESDCFSLGGERVSSAEAQHDPSKQISRVVVHAPATHDQAYRAVTLPSGTKITFRELIAFEGESAIYQPIAADLVTDKVMLQRLSVKETCAVYRDYYLGRPLPGPLYSFSTLSIQGHRTPSTAFHGLLMHPIGFFVGCIVLMAIHQFSLIDFTHATSVGFAAMHALLPLLVSAAMPRAMRAWESMAVLFYRAMRTVQFWPTESSNQDEAGDEQERVAKETG
jgi:hypothetical protein